MNEAPARRPGSSCRLRARPSTGRFPALISIHRASPCPRPARLSSNSAVPPSRSSRRADHLCCGRYVACDIPQPPCCLASGPPRHPPNSLPVSVVQARLICERPQAELSCKSAHASQARTLFSQMIIYRFYPAHASCPFSDLPLPTRGLAPADDGLQGIVRCGRLADVCPDSRR